MSILAALAKIGAIYAAKAAAKSQQVKAPKNIAGAFSVDPPKQAEATYSIDIKVDLKEAPAAGAYEWGSGIHATKGAASKYPIVPINKTYLAFMWPKVEGDPSFRRLPDGRVLLTSVQHPGVAPRPYLVPTINETKEEFKKILGQGFKAEILQGVNKIEVIEVK
jgi:hypothetical protein